MKKLFTIILPFLALTSFGQEITRIEYSIDAFVAEGNGTIVELSVGQTDVDANIGIDISGLSEGLHVLYSRSLNTDGVWSLPVRQSFYISNPDTTTIERIHYRVYNESYESGWMDSPVEPQRHIVDSLIGVSTTLLDMNENYSFEFYAVNSKGTRGFSTFLNNVDLKPNNAPTRLKDNLTLAMNAGETLKLSTDTLFNDVDMSLGDILDFTIANSNNQDIIGFTNYLQNNIIEFAPEHSNAGNYDFELTATDLSGEMVYIPATLAVYSITGIDNTGYSENGFQLYPNPAHDYLTIGNISDNCTLKIYNLFGQVLLEKPINSENNRIDLGNFSTGIYLVVLQNNEKTISRQLIIE